MAPNALRLQDVLRSVLAEQNVPKAEHAPERSEERAQLVAARYGLFQFFYFQLIFNFLLVEAQSER